MIRAWLQRISARAILLVGFAGFLAYAFPGYMSPDSDDQLIQARSHVFSDDHPPIMAAEWAVLDAIVSGPVLMLLVQGSLFLLGTAALLGRVMSPRRAAVAAVVVLWFPPVLTTLAVIWKDSQMAGYVIAGAAAVISPRRRVRLAGLALLTIGCAFRHNAFAATIPLIGLLFEWTPGLRWWKRYAISGAAAVASFALTLAGNHLLASSHPSMWDSVALADLAGVVTYSGDRSDAELADALRGTPLIPTTNIQAAIRATFSARHATTLFVGYGDHPVFRTPVPARDHDAIARAWKTLVAGDLGAYASYRLAVFREVLGLSEDSLWLPVWHRFVGEAKDEPVIHVNAAPSWVQRHLARWFSGLAARHELYPPYLYALLAVLLLVTSCRDRLTFALLVSGLLCELSLLVAAGTPDYRYSHWMICCTCLATIMLFARRVRAPVQNRGTNASATKQTA